MPIKMASSNRSPTKALIRDVKVATTTRRCGFASVHSTVKSCKRVSHSTYQLPSSYGFLSPSVLQPYLLARAFKMSFSPVTKSNSNLSGIVPPKNEFIEIELNPV